MALLAYVVVGVVENVSRGGGIGRYRLYGVLAAGGMATVHYGRQQGELGFTRTVAIKKLHPEYARDPEFVAMFMDEARLAARVHHPNVVQTLDVVASDDGLFLVMEYVRAISLSRLLVAAAACGERVPPALAAAVVTGVLHGLHAAHEATDEQGNPLDIVHRDVSPQNILVGADGVSRVLDFGIAKATGRAAHVTRDGQVKGKFAYMAPEQITNVRVTRQSDVFAASIVLWEALTGQRLFQAESEASLLARVLSAPIDPPSAVVPDLGPELDAVVARGLARDLSVRYESAQEMARDIELHVRLANTSQTSQWVQRLAGDELAQQAARVAEVESESPGERVSVATVLAAGERRATHAPTAAQQAGPKRSRRKVATILAASALTATAIGVAVFATRSLPLRAAERRETSTLPGGPIVGESSNPPTPSSLYVSASALPRPGASPAAAPRARDAKPTLVRSEVPSTTEHANDSSVQGKCDPPYYVDSKGHLIYKPECFR
jgi:serine/threonine protein kinase